MKPLLFGECQPNVHLREFKTFGQIFSATLAQTTYNSPLLAHAWPEIRKNWFWLSREPVLSTIWLQLGYISTVSARRWRNKYTILSEINGIKIWRNFIWKTAHNFGTFFIIYLTSSEIPNFLSEEECNHIISLANEKELVKSVARGGLTESDTWTHDPNRKWVKLIATQADFKWTHQNRNLVTNSEGKFGLTSTRCYAIKNQIKKIFLWVGPSALETWTQKWVR